MQLEQLVERVGRIARAIADSGADRASIEAAMADEAAVRASLDAAGAALVAKLRRHTAFVEPSVAEAGRTSLSAATRTVERADTLERATPLAHALGDGEISAGHVDAFTRASRQLDGELRGELFDRAASLASVAAASTIEEFRQRLRREVASIRSDDGEGRLRRQRAATRLSSWTDADGMWNLRGRFDPATGLTISSRLTAAIETAFAETVADDCPSDRVEKQKFLAAHALASLVEGAGGAPRPGRAEFVAVIDADATDRPGPVVERPIPIEVPLRVLADLTDTADVRTVVVRNGVVLHAPGNLDLGRSTRLANRAQRRALRGLYRGCAIPGCSVHFDRCTLHHIAWWRHGGTTDLGNLVPICVRHHGNIHHDGWTIELGSRRELTLRLPDGSIHNTGPPTIRAA